MSKLHKNQSYLRRLIRRIDKAPSPYSYLLWAFLVGSYFLWAGLTPMLHSKNPMEPLVPLITFAILIALYLLDRPHDLSFLIILTGVSILAGPLIFGLNIYRASTGSLNLSSSSPGLWRGQVVFFGIQFLGLILVGINFIHTRDRWKTADLPEKQTIKRSLIFLLILGIILSIPLFYFIGTGLLRHGRRVL